MPKNGTACQKIEVPLKPLNLHQKILNIDPNVEENLVLNKLSIVSKSLSISDGLQWIGNILPDLPTIVDQSKDSVTFLYQSSFVKTYLIITLK